MSKPGNVGTKGKARLVEKGLRSNNSPLPINTQESNRSADRKAKAIWIALLSLSGLLCVLGLFVAGWQVYAALTARPIQWLGLTVGAVCIPLVFLLSRGLVWLAYFAAIMYAAKNKAWYMQEELCHKVLGLWKIIPGGASTGAVMLVQSLFSRGKFDEAITVGETQWQRFSGDQRHDQSLAPLCASIAVALQVQGRPKDSISWSERAIASYKRVMEQMANPKGILQKLAASQQANWSTQMQAQLSLAHFNLASAYFNTMNHRHAKENFRQAVEYGLKSGDTPEIKEVLRVSKEQLARLKHV